MPEAAKEEEKKEPEKKEEKEKKEREPEKKEKNEPEKKEEKEKKEKEPEKKEKKEPEKKEEKEKKEKDPEKKEKKETEKKDPEKKETEKKDKEPEKKEGEKKDGVEAASVPASAAVPSTATTQKVPTNKPGEPNFKLELSPETVVFECKNDKKPVFFDLKITNNTKDKHTFKVKCTAAELFRLQPPIGTVKAQDSTTVRIWFQNKGVSDPTKHYFAILHMKVPEGKSFKDCWNKTTKPEGVKRINAVFKGLDGK